LLRHGLALLARPLAQSQEVRSALLSRISLRHFLLLFPMGFRGTCEASLRQRTLPLYFRVFHHLVLDDILRSRTPLYDADHRFQRFPSLGAYVVHHQLLARGTKGLVALFQTVLPDCVSDCVQYVERLKSRDAVPRNFFSFESSVVDVVSGYSKNSFDGSHFLVSHILLSTRRFLVVHAIDHYIFCTRYDFNNPNYYLTI